MDINEIIDESESGKQLDKTDDYLVIVSARVPQRVRAVIDAKSSKLGFSRSEYVRDIIEEDAKKDIEFLKNHNSPEMKLLYQKMMVKRREDRMEALRQLSDYNEDIAIVKLTKAMERLLKNDSDSAAEEIYFDEGFVDNEAQKKWLEKREKVWSEYRDALPNEESNTDSNNGTEENY